MNINTKGVNLLNSVVIKPRRVFSCKGCGSILPRKNIYKDKNSVYRCSTDHTVVEDITNRKTGQDFMEIVGI